MIAFALQGLLETQLAGQPFSSGELLSDYLRLFQANTDAAIVKMLQVKLLVPVSCTPYLCLYALLCQARSKLLFTGTASNKSESTVLSFAHILI